MTDQLLTKNDESLFISYAQNFEDVLLNRIFKDQREGFYIDIGAHHPTHDSVTKSFYDRGWKGINIEPVKEFFELLQKERTGDINLNLAISDSQGEVDFFELIGSGFSTLNYEMATRLAEEKSLMLSKYTVSTKTLADICREHVNCPIDFLKVDVEGWEEKVVFGNDWQKFRPKIVIVEATIPDSPIRCETQIPNFLKDNNYQQVYFDGLNDFYVAKECSELTKHFDKPVSIFDNFVLFKLINPEPNNLNSNWDALANYNNESINNLVNKIESVDSNFDINEENDRNTQEKIDLQNRLITILKNAREDQFFEIRRLREMLTKIQKENNEKINTYEKETIDLQNQLNSVKRQVWEAKEWIIAMESSKFWQIRKRWFNIKRIIGLSTD